MSAHRTSISRRWAAEIERDRIYRALRDKREHESYLAQLARERASDVLDGAVSLSDVPTHNLVQHEDELRDVPPERWQEKRWKPSLPIVQMSAEQLDELPTYSH